MIRKQYEMKPDRHQRSRSRSEDKNIDNTKIREQYLGIKQEKKKDKESIYYRERQRNILKFKWDDSEDTYDQKEREYYGNI